MMSDHCPCISSVNLVEAKQQINTDLLNTDWTYLHQLTTNMAYESFNKKKLIEITDKHASLKTHMVANKNIFKRRRMDVTFIDQMFQEML